MEKKTGNLGCFVCPLPVFFSLNYQPLLATLTLICFIIKKAKGIFTPLAFYL